MTTNDLDYLKGYLPKIAAVTNDDIKKVANKYLVAPKGVVIWSVPAMGEKEKGFAPSDRGESTAGARLIPCRLPIRQWHARSSRRRERRRLHAVSEGC